jgi:hypothetical protein
MKRLFGDRGLDSPGVALRVPVNNLFIDDG